MKQIGEKIAAQISGSVRTGELLSRHTSFRIGGPADLFIEPKNTNELIAVLRCLQHEGIPVFFLGNGTNLLVSDAGFRGAVVRLSGELSRYVVNGNNVDAGAGVSLSTLSKEMCERGLAGLDFAAGIPGTVGGALVTNAGAHGAAMNDVLVSADILDSNLMLHTLTAENLNLTYRKSSILPNTLVCRVRLRLRPGDRDTLLQSYRSHLDFRRKRQPRQPNAGSIFKNPPGQVTGRLIEAAGLKGRRSGAAMISDVHANFIVNCGGATADDVLTLISLAKAEVELQFGKTLELEIRLLGN